MSVRSVGPSPVHFLRARPFAAVIPGDNVAAEVLATGLSSFLSLYNAALIGRLILTWFPNPPQVIAQPLSTVCDPYLNLFRGLIPPIGGTIDLSPILAFIVLDLFSNSAASLSAEVGPDGQMVHPQTQNGGMGGMGQMWRRRMQLTEERKEKERNRNRSLKA